MLKINIYNIPQHPKRQVSQQFKYAVILPKKELQTQKDFLQQVFAGLKIDMHTDVNLIVVSPEMLGQQTIKLKNTGSNKYIIFEFEATDLQLPFSSTFFEKNIHADRAYIFFPAIQVFIDEKAKGGARPLAKMLWNALKAF